MGGVYIYKMWFIWVPDCNRVSQFIHVELIYSHIIKAQLRESHFIISNVLYVAYFFSFYINASIPVSNFTIRSFHLCKSTRCVSIIKYYEISILR